MPLWGDSRKENFKGKLEHKMCIAKDAPDDNFDLSDCNLSEVPSGIFSMCRVFRKNSLLLQNNVLSNLSSGGSFKDLSHILILNLKNNKLSSLPAEIGFLSKLQVLNLENNQLKKLPTTFETLINLHHLNLKSNRLHSFPMPVCTLQNLKSLNMCNNPKIKSLPNELSNLVHLKEISIDAENFSHPSLDICLGGIEQIMKTLCNEIGKEYCPFENSDISKQHRGENAGCLDDEVKSPDIADISAAYLQYQSVKERRRQELLIMEEALQDSLSAQSTISADTSMRKKKLLNDIAQDQERMENEILLLQSKKEGEKKLLLNVLMNIENHSAQLIDQLMKLSDRNKDLEKMTAIIERDRIESEEIFSINQEKLEQIRKKEILEAMTEMLKCEEQCGKYVAERSNMVEKLQNEENESSKKLNSLFQEREIDQQFLINKLLEEEQYQKEAFEALQLQKDIHHQEIAHKIHLVEKELSNLTSAEIKKKDLKLSSDINTLAEHRIALASLLTDLMTDKEKRELELKERLEQMELKRKLEMEDFWLIQYQNLLDRKPRGITTAELGVDDDIRTILLVLGAVEYLPLFASKRTSFMKLLNFTLKDLKKMGILDDNICAAILEKAQGHYKLLQSHGEEPMVSNWPQPSAPPEPEEEEGAQPSAPPLSPDTETKLWCQTECVVCLDVQTSAVFLPCGHVCCCQSCSNQVDLCPMCRTMIVSRFILTVS